MRHIHYLLSSIEAALFLGLLFASLPAAADTIRTGGTGSALGTIKILANAFEVSHPDTKIIAVPAMGSSGGIKAVAADALDIGLSGRPLKPNERALSLTEQEIARTPLVLASMRTHVGFTLNELARIFDGTLRTWPDGSPLRPILRPQSDSETALLRAISPEMDHSLTVAHARQGVHIAITDQDSADAIEHIPGALGTSTLALVLSERRKIKVLPLNGVTPNVTALARGDYPYFKPLYLIARQNPPEPVRAFIVFVRSAQGSKILRDNGYLPMMPMGK